MDDQTTDTRDLAQFGYRQRLDRTLGAVTTFALAYGWVAILVGVNALFFFGFGAAGPAFVWVYVVVGFIQLMTGLCLAEMAGHLPVAGSMYQWSKHVAQSRFVPWIAGWILIAAMIVTVTVLGPTLQQTLTTVSSSFQLVGGAHDIGTSTTHNGAINAILLGGIATALVTLINVVGVKWTARITSAAVVLELTAVCVVVIGFLFNITRGPGVIFETHGTGAGHAWGYFGAFLIAFVSGAYVFFGFESAATLAEETREPRKTAPRAILRALGVSIAIAIVLAVLAEMAVPDINSPELSTVGFPFVITSTLGSTLGKIILVVIAIAVTSAVLAIQATAVRVIFAMARDDRLPLSRQLAHVSDRWKTPALTTVAVAVAAIALLFVNYGNPTIFSTIGAVAILLFYICYLLVVGPMLLARMRGDWPPPSSSTPGFSLGRWGVPVNIAALVGALVVAVDVAWPRVAVYGNAHWYLQYGAFTFTGLILLVGIPYYLLVQRHRAAEVVLEHSVAAQADDLGLDLRSTPPPAPPTPGGAVLGH
jgi:urea carboxylase system permease